MKIHYVLAPEDHIAFNLYHLDHSPAMRRNYWSQVAWSGLALLAFFGYLSVHQETLAPVLTFLLISPLLFLLFAWLWKRQMKGNVQKMIAEGRNQGFYGPQELELANGQVIARSAGRMSATDTRFIEKIVQTPTHLFLYLSGLSALIVPLAFVTADELDDFLDALNEECPDLQPQPTLSTAITEYVRGQEKSKPI